MTGESISFARLDARSGRRWLARALAMFRAAPLPWLLLLFTYYLLIALSEVGPWSTVSQFLAPLLKPVFAVGFLAAAWAQERGGAPKFADLFRGFRSNLGALILIGAVFLGGMLLAVQATKLVDDGHLIGLLAGREKPTEELLITGRVQAAMLVGMACALPTLLATWFAPALVVFNDASAMNALGTSLRAAFANWRPIAVYGLALFAFGGVLPTIALAIAQLFGETIASLLAVLFVTPYFVVFIATLHISDYVSYREIFHPDEQPSGVATSA